MKVVLVRYKYDGSEHCWYRCPGCGYDHAFSPSVHRWNGDRERPTVTPSLLQSNPQGHHTCHSFITDGKIAFLGDCWHGLKYQTVELPEFDVGRLDGAFVEIIDK